MIQLRLILRVYLILFLILNVRLTSLLKIVPLSAVDLFSSASLVISRLTEFRITHCHDSLGTLSELTFGLGLLGF